MNDKKYGFETLLVHAGAAPDPATGARALPIPNRSYALWARARPLAA